MAITNVLEALRAGRLEDPGKLPAFVTRACRNTVLDWRKVERRRGALLEKFGPSSAAPSSRSRSASIASG